MDAQAFNQFILKKAHNLEQESGAVRRCTQCREVKPETDFTWSSGLGYFCKECSRKKLNAVKKHLQRKSGARK